MAFADLGPRTSDLGKRNVEKGLQNTHTNPKSKIQNPQSLLAWAGWQMRIPSDWQPLKLTGTPAKGQMIVGNDEVAVFIVKWEHPTKDRLHDGQQWVSERLTRHGVVSDANPPAKAYFTACGWARDVQTEEDKETTYWYGYAEKAALLIGITVNGVLPAADRRIVVEQVLPSLVTTPAGGESVWAMYDLSFTVPAGFQLAQRHLYSGDVALQFVKGPRESLLLRQVYPGELALGRRSWEKWLNSSPFTEHRHIRRGTMRQEIWRHQSRKELTGMQRTGWKRVPFPLGWCSPRQARSIGAHDSVLNRLLMVEHVTAGLPHEGACVKAIEQMNRVAGGHAGGRG